MNNARYFWVLVAAAASTLLCSVAPATAAPRAAASPQLRIAPLTLDVSLAPGESATRDVMISAGGASPLTVTFEHADFGFSNGDYGVQLIEDNSPTTVDFSTRGWFTVKSSTIRIPAGKTLTIPVTIAAPGNASPGTHLGAALFRTSPGPAPASGSQIVTSARTGPLIFVTIRGGSRPKPRISRLTAPALLTHGPIPVTLSAAVSGDGYVRVTGTIELSGNNVHDKIEIPEKIVVGGSHRVLIPAAHLDHQLGGKSLKVGRYTVTSTLTIAPTGRTLTRTVHVWLIPVWLDVALAGALLLVIASIVMGIRLFVRSRRELAVAMTQVDDDLVHDETADEDAYDEPDNEHERSSDEEDGDGDMDSDPSLDDDQSVDEDDISDDSDDFPDHENADEDVDEPDKSVDPDNPPHDPDDPDATDTDREENTER